MILSSLFFLLVTVPISLFWVLNFCDGKNNLLDISKRSKIKIENIKRVSEILMKKGLIEKI